jgi:broad specificity phosphatase PhoE
MSTLFLVRHGQASFGAHDYDRLSPTGVEQSHRLGQSLASRSICPDVVVTGCMTRHRETAQSCLNGMNLAFDMEESASWNEYDYESLLWAYRPAWRDRNVMREELAASGDARRAFQAVFSAAMARWMSGEDDSAYPETWAAFQARAVKAATDLHDALPTDCRAFVFTSGGVIAAIVGALLCLGDLGITQLSWTLTNASVTRLHGNTGRLKLLALNEHSHFEPETRLITWR